ncbi:MAG TPA: sigma 54-interacting transcriptional regulator [Polyangium sp.]|nr:sigma 54-interacting transcriptional regulator [Polyangium sp.]
MPQLIIHEPGQGPLAVALTVPLNVGRDDQCDLPLRHRQVSRNHSRFEPDGAGWVVRDLGSANSTFVNGLRVEQARLAHGDVIHIGPVRLVYREENEPEVVIAQSASNEPTLELGPPNRRLELLFEIARAMGALDDSDALLGRMLESVLELVGGERGVVTLVRVPTGDVLRRITRVRGALVSKEEEIIVSRKLVQAMLERRESVVVHAVRDPNAPATLSRFGIRSAMGTPLEAAGRVLGYLYIDDRSRQEQFGAADLDFLRALARLLASTLDNAERLARAHGIAEAASGFGPVQEIVGQSPAIQKLRVQIVKYGASSASGVLILGESGTGKELVARALHAASARAPRPFVAVNCAAIPDTMIESALFGYEKGAFTGATSRMRGHFVLADQGTLLLDEVGDLSLSAQAKVLRALQEREILPLGTETPLRVDVRVIAATHKDLRREIAEGRFREDLYYRLNALTLETPPLRERGADIELLAQLFIEAAALNLGKQLGGFSPTARAALIAYPWPGNVRELRNEVERAAIEAEGAVVELDDLSPTIVNAFMAPASLATPIRDAASLAARFASLEPMERALVVEALAAARGNLTEAARQLGITRIMMRRRVERFGLRCRDT